VNDAWVQLLKQQDSPPLPSRLFSSPLSRALSTMEISYNNILLSNPANKTSNNPTEGGLQGLLNGIFGQHRVTPETKELFREEYGDHTCDKRRTKSEIHADYPNVKFEAGFAEDDTLWTTTRETDDHLNGRIHQALTEMWNEAQQDQVVSLTSHSGVMQSLFNVVGHTHISPATGAFIPLIIKATPQN